MTTRITQEEVERIIRLCRIELGADERAAFAHELPAILDFVAKLNEVPTAGIQPMAGGTELSGVMREDEIPVDGIGPDGSMLVLAAPQKRDGYIEVKAVFDREA